MWAGKSIPSLHGGFLADGLEHRRQKIPESADGRDHLAAILKNPAQLLRA